MEQKLKFDRSWTRYAVAVLLVGLAAAIRVWPLAALGSSLAWLTFYPAVMLAAIHGGFIGGVFAATLSGLAVTFLWPLFATQAFITNSDHWLGMLVFMLNGLLVSAVAEAMHRAQARAIKAQMETASTALSHLLFESSPTAMLAIEPKDGRVIRANCNALKMWGYEAAEIHAKKLVELTCPDDVAATRALVDQFRMNLVEELQFEKRYLRKDGSYFWGETRVSTLKADGNTDLVIGSTIDITERKRAHGELLIAATAFEAQEGIIITDANKVILRVNRAFTAITGYKAEEAVGQTPRLLRSGRQDAAYYKVMWDSVSRDGYWKGEIWNRRKNGEEFPEWLTIAAVKGRDQEVTNYVGTLVDVTMRKSAELEIEYLAYHDHLTKLPNRRMLIDRLQQALASCGRNGRKGAVLFIDLDNFKILNDTSGYDVGDQLLIDVAKRLGNCVREGDTIARLGGDEFVVVLEDLSEAPQEAAAQARGVGVKILTTLSQPYNIAGQVHHSTPSIGVTLFIEDEDSVDELLKQAGIAMYQAKAAGRNTLRFFDPAMQATLAARATLEAALRLGLENRQFVLHYQPQFDEDRAIIGAEALLRWEHPERGLVNPGEFISLAEETGLILPLGQWVLEVACARLKDWEGDPRTRDLVLAINISARQFRQPDFVDQVCQALRISGAPPDRLKLELTESVVLDNVEDTIEKMKRLKPLGVGFSMDDFGTGYSSLSYLTRLPLDQLKIDQSFVRNLPGNPGDCVVVQTIITMAVSLGLTVIAEGVETEAQRRFLEQHGCRTYQGYLFGEPVALPAFERLVVRNRPEKLPLAAGSGVGGATRL